MRGVCVYAAQHLGVSDVSIKLLELEQVMVKISLRGSDCLIIASVYRSPSSNPDESIGHIRQLQLARSMSSSLLFVGDFNFPQIDWELEVSRAPTNHYSHAFLDVLRDFFLFQHVQHPTRFRLGETPSVLNLVLTNEEGMVTHFEHLPGLGSSDHCILQFTLVCYAVTSFSPPQYHNHTDYRLLAETLRSCDWNQITDMDLEESYSFFKSCINEALEGSTQRRKVRSKKHLYMNQRALQLKKNKKMLWCTYCRTGDMLDHARFVRCRNALRR